MHPASFDESNATLEKPPGMTDEECGVLSVCQAKYESGTPLVISCWKPTAEELAEIQRTGRVWLGILGHTMPPAWVSGWNPFNEAPDARPNPTDQEDEQGDG